MKFLRLAPSLPVSLAVLRVAAWVTPRHQRVEWFAEWKAELWHVWHACDEEARSSSRGKEDALAFSLGAFKDALWLRRNGAKRNSLDLKPSNVLQLGSPSRCGFALASLAAVGMLLAYLLPEARKIVVPLPYQNAQNLVLISNSGRASTLFPTIPLAEYRSWKDSTHRLFTGIAFYQPISKRVHIARHETAKLSIARASDNLFVLLHVPVSTDALNPGQQECAAKLILSNATWQKYFHADPHVAGRILEVAGQRAIVIGVLSDNSWRLPVQTDAWLLEDEHQLAVLPSHAKGFVLADVRTSAFSNPRSGQWRMSVPKPDGSFDSYDCISLTEQSQQAFSIFLFALVLACLALPATTSLPLGEYPTHSRNLPLRTSIRRWVFLVAKIVLVTTIVYFASIDLAHCSRNIAPFASQYIQLGISFMMLLFAFRWALRDQRKRCPVCLRLLTHPARVGQASRNFLAWNGTELMCAGGHGLLHVPDMPTSWFSTQRWLYLDPSWSGLFSDAYLGML